MPSAELIKSEEDGSLDYAAMVLYHADRRFFLYRGQPMSYTPWNDVTQNEKIYWRHLAKETLNKKDTVKVENMFKYKITVCTDEKDVNEYLLNVTEKTLLDLYEELDHPADYPNTFLRVDSEKNVFYFAKKSIISVTLDPMPE